MAKNDIISYSTTAGDNTDVDSVNIAEGMAPSGVNNAMRAIMSHLAERFGSTVSVASAATVALGDQEEQYVEISGTTGITSFGTPTVANEFGFWVKFDSSLLLTHNGTSLILPGAVNITTQAGDAAFFQHLGTGVGNWRMLAYMPGNSTPGCGFSAHKNSTDQLGIVPNTWTILTFSTEAYDRGGHFVGNTWTPPAGLVSIKAACLVTNNVVDGNNYIMAVYKDGAILRARRDVSADNSIVGTSIAIDDVANGANAYTVWVNFGGAGNKTVDGGAASTYFMGHVVQ